MAVIALAVVIGYSVSFHPTFFGDELFGTQLSLDHGGRFWPAYREWNEYKPRLVLAALLAGFAWLEVPRAVYASTSALLALAVCTAAYVYVRNELKETRLLALAVAGAILTSRYGSMFYFDYVAGILELLSLSLFLCLCWVLLRHHGSVSGASPGRTGLVMFALALGCVFVHERYAAPAGVVLAAAGYLQARQNVTAWPGFRRATAASILAIACASIPLAAYLVAHQLSSAGPLLTGTAGLEVTLGVDSVKALLIYLSNVLLGTTWGNQWHWGSANVRSVAWKAVALVIAVVSVVSIVGALRTASEDRRRRGQAYVLGVAALVLAIMASLPGTDRQEARWAFPVFVLGLLAVCAGFRGRWRWCLIALPIAASATHWGSGAYREIYNVYSSRAADTLVRGTDCLHEASGRLLIGGLGGEDAWVFTGWRSRAGAAFSKLNFANRLSVDYLSSGARRRPRDLDTRAYSSGALGAFSERMDARFKCLAVSVLLAAVGEGSVEVLPTEESILSGPLDWASVTFNKGLRTPPYLIGPESQGWIRVPAERLDGRVLVYRLRGAGPASPRFRLQVNWHDGADVFLSSAIRVVPVGLETERYGIYLDAPGRAKWGLVYFGFHDGPQEGLVEVLDVEIRGAPSR